MPVRSLSSPVLKWPDRVTVSRAVKEWAEGIIRENPEVLRLGYFGSFARADWGVGSDLDLIAIVADSDEPFERRSLSWDTTVLPVPADCLIYTKAEWGAMKEIGSLFYRRLEMEAKWLVSTDGSLPENNEKELIRRRIQAWGKAAPKLEHIRREDIINADTTRAIIAFEGPFQSALIHHGLRPTSGLVQLQEIFKLLVDRRPPKPAPGS